ncbi:hypothetical protein TNIN_467611 [Trichonephila inaurata madagascariensis]|uniref:MATH domain-containing protein n=1 Tax=Trichonephila inaurata madagascariensis TaxID=2747483 RepID=A0A8X6WWJ5_9ARAC|nr:hypothetical protein TNIN_467611 [Trichonephila inaurata madagascariensis]
MIEWDQNEHVIDWDVENFSCCPQTTGKYFSTGRFQSQILDKTSWQINLFPRGINNADDISCFLERIEDDNVYPTEIVLTSSFVYLLRMASSVKRPLRQQNVVSEIKRVMDSITS